jgi:hypothetical protein
MQDPNDPSRLPTKEPAASVGDRTYVAPCVEDDLPLEVMSLACQGLRPKQATPIPCATIGSLPAVLAQRSLQRDAPLSAARPSCPLR